MDIGVPDVVGRLEILRFSLSDKEMQDAAYFKDGLHPARKGN